MHTMQPPAKIRSYRCIGTALLATAALLSWPVAAGAQTVPQVAQDPSSDDGVVEASAAERRDGSQQRAKTRAEIAQQLRVAKSADLSPRRRSGLENKLAALEEGQFIPGLFRGWRGFGLAAGDFPGGAGFGFGIGFRDDAVGSLYPREDLRNRLDLSANASKSTRGYTDLRAEVGLSNLGGSGFGVRLKAAYFEWKEMPFFGRGQDSREELESNFRFDSGELGGEVFWRQGRVELSAGSFLLTPEIAAGESSEFPSFDLLFDPADVAGAALQPDFVRYDAGLAYDGRPKQREWTAFSGPGGGYYAVKYSYYDDRDLGQYDFRRIEVELQQHIPVKWRRAIVLRANAVFTDTSDDNVVPFYYQPTLGGQSMLRSFPEYRFYDDNRLLLTGEYRWAAWSALNMALFVDLGKVYPDSESLSLDDLETSYGVGFRFKSAFGFLARVDLAHGDEGLRTVAVWESVF